MCLGFTGVNGRSVLIMKGAHEKETEMGLWRETGTSLKSWGCSRDRPHRTHLSSLKATKDVISVGPAFYSHYYLPPQAAILLWP